MFNFIKYVVEGKEIKKLEQVPLNYPRDGLGKSLSKQAIDYHYGKLYKAYVDRFNAGEGDADFNDQRMRTARDDALDRCRDGACPGRHWCKCFLRSGVRMLRCNSPSS